MAENIAQGGPTGTTRLITGPGAHPATARAAREHDPHRTRLLGVTTAGDPDALLWSWRQSAGEDPVQTGIITVSDLLRSAAERAGHGSISLTPSVSLRTVSGADDLRELCLSIGQYLDEWSETSERTVIALDSLPALVDSTGSAEVFRFLHVLTAFVAEYDAVAYVDVSDLDNTALETMDHLLASADS